MAPRVQSPILRVVAGHSGKRDSHGIYLMHLYGEGDFVEARTEEDGSFLLLIAMAVVLAIST